MCLPPSNEIRAHERPPLPAPQAEIPASVGQAGPPRGSPEALFLGRGHDGSLRLASGGGGASERQAPPPPPACDGELGRAADRGARLLPAARTGHRPSA